MRQYIRLFLLTSALLQVLIFKGYAQDELRNLPELSLPILKDKLVIAHCMTNIIRYKGHPFEDSCNPDYYPPKGNVSAPLGGLTQVKPMADRLLSTATLEEAVEFEMRAAIRSGIDGFQFYYTLGNKSWDEIIKAYFKVADQKHLDFKFTFCISHPDGGTEAGKIAEFAERINAIFNAVGQNSTHWLRTPDGRLIVYQWNGEGLADQPKDLKGLTPQYYMARAYKKLADAVGERFACVFTINKEISKKELNAFLDYFPATWIWTLPYSGKQYIGERVAQLCKERHRTFTGSAFNDFYTSKLLKKGTWDMFHTAQQATAAGIGQVERKYITTGLSYNFRKLLEFSIQKEVPIINIITWNDYPEGHHLAPEINHNDGFSILLNQYKSEWKQTTSPYSGKDVAILFFKKYRHNIKPSPFNIRVLPFQKEAILASAEDWIEVVSLLKQPATLWMNGKSISAPAGFSVSRFPMQAGEVALSVMRNQTEVLKLKAFEGITDHPYRTDRITYSISSEFDSFYENLYKGFYPIFSTEYNPGTSRPE